MPSGRARSCCAAARGRRRRPFAGRAGGVGRGPRSGTGREQVDADAVLELLGNLLVERGVVATWDEVLRPVLVAVGERWERTGEGVEVEHLLSEATTDALRAHRARQLRAVPGRCVLLACAPEDEHVLPLHIAAVDCAERRVPVRLLGPRVPASALVSATRRLRASGVLVWKQRAKGRRSTSPGCRRCGPAWCSWSAARMVPRARVPPGARRVGSLASAVAVLQVAPR